MVALVSLVGRGIKKSGSSEGTNHPSLKQRINESGVGGCLRFSGGGEKE